MSRKPWFWIAAVVLSSLAAAAFAFAFFPRAFPLVDADIRVDRGDVLQSADELARRHGWGPSGHRQAATFGVDDTLQAFVELEAGGADAFRELMAGGLISPYAWRVRHFREGEVTTTVVRFTPGGEPHGFRVRLPEDQEGAALEAAAARALAEEAAAGEPWSVAFEDWELVEEKEDVRPSGRVDHAFVYRHVEESVGAAEVRLRLRVGGDRLIELRRFVKVPEAFERRYREMRSFNNTLGAAASAVALMLFLGAGGGVATFLLVRRRGLEWKPALAWAAGIGLLQALLIANQIPLAWMGYDTALLERNFLLQQLGLMVLAFVGTTLFAGFTFLTAEGLTRLAFPHHPRLWRLWRKDVASTPAVAGRTVAGYLLVPAFFAYEVALYLFSTSTLGWWAPAGELRSPDVIATWLPWLPAIAISAQAGFWEECLFRALPIAGAALLGERFGHRRLLIVGAVVLQALVFGAAHANYPAQPFYARLVELIVPSLAFAFLYLRFGLLVAIVLHYVFDVVWIAMPLFASSADGIWIDRSLVIALALVPLGAVLLARARSGRWRRLDEDDLNAGWTPQARVERDEPPLVARPPIPSRIVTAACVAGILALGAWAALARFSLDVPSLGADRDEAESVAAAALSQRGVELSSAWERMSVVQSPLDDGDRFTWREGGEAVYRELLGRYLRPPYWRVRRARFTGDVAERAEEHVVEVSHDGRVLGYQHVLPEGRPGAELDEEAARGLAHEVVRDRWKLDPAELDEVSASPSRQPERVDWRFTFADREAWPLEEGEARVAVEIAGDEVTGSYRFVHVPEDWQRTERDRRAVLTVIQVAGVLTVALVIVAAVIGAVVAWARGRFVARTALTFYGLLVVVTSVVQWNGWPQVVASFDTATPRSLQVGTAAVTAVLAALVVPAVVALLAGLAQRLSAPNPGQATGRLLAGLSVGVAAAALTVEGGLASRLGRLLSPAAGGPAWGDLSSASARIPVLSEALSPLVGFTLVAATGLLVLSTLDRLTERWSRRRAPLGLLLVLLALLGTAATGPDSVAGWLAGGTMAGLGLLAAYVLVFRHDMALVPVAAGAWVALGRVQVAAQSAHAAALPGGVASAVLILALALWWSRHLREPGLEGAGLAAVDESALVAEPRGAAEEGAPAW